MLYRAIVSRPTCCCKDDREIGLTVEVEKLEPNNGGLMCRVCGIFVPTGEVIAHCTAGLIQAYRLTRLPPNDEIEAFDNQPVEAVRA